MAFDNPSYFQFKQYQNDRKLSEKKLTNSFFNTINKNPNENFISGQPRRNDIAPKYRNCCQHSPYSVKFTNLTKIKNHSSSLKRFAEPLENNFQEILNDHFDQNNNSNNEKVTSEDIVLPSVILSKKICSNCTPSNSSTKNESEIVSIDIITENALKYDNFKVYILSSTKSTIVSSWVNYFKQLFAELEKNDNQTIKYQVECINISDEIKEFKLKSNLQIVIVCPKVLDFIRNNEDAFSWIDRSTSENCLIIFLGLNEIEINSIKQLPISWRKFTVDRDKDELFIREFIEEIREIIKKQKQKKLILKNFESNLNLESNNNLALKNYSFSVMPKKVKSSSNRVFILLSEPLKKDDTVQVLIEKADHLFAISHIQRKNPYTIKFTMPDTCFTTSIMVSIMIAVNNQLMSCKRPIKCESRLKELELLLRNDNNPIELMCKALNLSNSTRQELDEWMANNFRRNVPKGFHLITKDNQLENFQQTNEEYPTLLHFSARFGFENLCLQLIECPGGENACQITNSCGLTPIEIAHNAGYHQLADYLKNFSEMTELNKVYDLLKNIDVHDERLTMSNIKDEVLKTTLTEAYLIPPPARPIEKQQIDNSYMNVNVNFEHKNNSLSENDNSNGSTFLKVDPKPYFDDQINNEKNSDLISQKSAQSIITDKYQNELIEILNDFKNDIFSINEVEKLFENWKNRNEVKQSFLEKQQQLNNMRLEYEKIQQLMKTDLRKLNPFEKFKKLFTKHKSNRSNNNSLEFQVKNPKRPLSNISISTNSSSSSLSPSSCGRNSTNSFFSRTDDSGTHSDVEDFNKKISHEYIELDENIQNTYINVPIE